jgi:Glycosyltransferase
MAYHKEISVLVLSYYMICPPISGGAKRMLYPAMHLSPEDHIRFHYMYFTYSENKSKHNYNYLNQFPLIIGNTPFMVSRNFQFNETGIPKSLNQQVWWYLNRNYLNRVLGEVKKNNYDIIQIEHSDFAWLIPHIRLACSAKIVLDCQNLEWLVYKRWLPYAVRKDRKRVEKSYISLKQWEEKVLSWFDALYCISPIEQRIIKEMVPEVMTYYVPSGASVDDERYNPGLQRREQPRDLLFIGSMNWFPNAHALIWFLDKVYPLIQKELPDTKLDIIGSGEPQMEMLRRIQKNKNVTFWGEVEDEVPCLHQSKVFISPIWIGAGVRLKNPTAWIARLPVVATSLSVEGLEYTDGEDILIGDTPERFAEQTIRLLRDADLRERISKQAYQSYQEKYSEKQICDRWKFAYYSTIDKILDIG